MMKRTAFMMVLIALLLAVAAGALVMISCGGRSAAQPPPSVALSPAPPGPNPRYYAIQQKLDQGGSFYLYCDLKDQLKSFMDMLRPYAMKPGMPPEALRIHAIANMVLDRLGLYGIHDLGISAIPEGGLTLSKCYVSAPEGRERGILKILGGAPHPLALLDRASSATLVVATADLDVPALWELVRQVVADLGGVSGTTMIDKRLADVKDRTGLDVEAMVNSLGGELAFYLDQDPSSKLVIPLGLNKPMMTDTPRLALLAKVKDATIYNSIKGLLQLAQAKISPEATEGKLKYFQITAPANPVWVVAPTLGFDGEYLYISSHAELACQLAGPSKSPLRETAEFKKLTAGMPTEGNGVSYTSPRLGAVIREALEQAIVLDTDQAKKAQGQFVVDLIRDQAGAAGMRVNDPNGVLTINRSKGSGAQYMGALLVVPVGIVAAVALPKIIEAKSGEKKIARARADLRTLSIALETYMMDNNVYPAWAVPPDPNANGMQALPGQPTFRVKRNDADPLMTLTTPISYISQYYGDPFAPNKGNTYSYWATPQAGGYILWSPGPDGKYDLSLDNIGKLYDMTGKIPSPGLIDTTFDPSNGTRSRGDIYRYKQ